MPTNDFIGFASAGSANVMSQADYAAAAEQTDGVQPGPASSALANKIWRQGANMAAALGEMIASQGGDALDNGDIAALKTALESAIGTVDIISAATAEFRLTGGLQILTGTGNSSSSGSVHINFSHAFAAKPRVVITGGGSSTTLFAPKVDNISTTGFDLYDIGANGYINNAFNYWLAFGIGA